MHYFHYLLIIILLCLVCIYNIKATCTIQDFSQLIFDNAMNDDWSKV